MKNAYCEKHKVEFDELLWCPMCLQDEMDADMEKREHETELDTQEDNLVTL
jgi:hypothetical protein